MKKITTMKKLLNERLSEEDIIKLVSNYDNKFSELEKENKEQKKEIERLNNIINEIEDSIVGKINVLYQVRGQSNAIQELSILLKQLKELKGSDSNE